MNKKGASLVFDEKKRKKSRLICCLFLEIKKIKTHPTASVFKKNWPEKQLNIFFFWP